MGFVHSTKILSGMVESVGDTVKCSHPAMVKLRTHHATIRTLPIIRKYDFIEKPSKWGLAQLVRVLGN